MSLEITATCGCGRIMRADGAKGRGHMVCGCGRRIHVEVPNRMVYEHGMCAWVHGNRGCTDGAIHAKVPLCEAHVRKTVEFAAENRWLLAANLADRQQYPKLARDIEATPEDQERARRDQFQKNVTKQRQKIMDAVAGAGTVVYYVQLAPDRIKVGVTSGLRQRMGAFRAPLSSVLAVEPGSQALETARHRRFAAHRIDRPGNREEYHPVPELMDWIALVRSEHGEPFDAIRRLKLAAVTEMRASGPLLFGPNQGIYDRLEAGLRAPVEGEVVA